MAVSGVVSEIFNVKKYRDLEIRVRGHSSLLELTPINLTPTTSYHRSIVSMVLSRTVSEIDGDFAMRMRSTTSPVRGGCKIITYLESLTASFLLTVQLSSGYDND